MRIGVIGSGAVGCFYGARLARAGHEVHFLMRRDYEAVRDGGLTVHSRDGDFRLESVRCHARSEEIGPVDWVLCALKTTALDAAPGLIGPCVGRDTRILAMMNGLGAEQRLAESFEPWRVFGGLAFVCCNRGEPGHVHHLDYGRVAFGHLLDDRDEVGRIAAIFAEAGIEAQPLDSLKQARWEKLVWNIPFNSLSVSAGGISTRRILDDELLGAEARELMLETIEAGNACGCSISPDPLVDKMFANTETMGHYRTSMQIDFEEKRPLEVESILGEPVRQARAAGHGVPHIGAQYALVRFLDRINRQELTRYA
ncbi:MAG: 2-dehydropantoate 2-reductase [Phycisphaerae bacterium]|nr:2-dehydropantoate 2-reductase [Phycisphaerae bacterium]